jgi:anti-sigma regulatory factor (Ser/Thr protein kinase)
MSALSSTSEAEARRPSRAAAPAHAATIQSSGRQDADWATPTPGHEPAGHPRRASEHPGSDSGADAAAPTGIAGCHEAIGLAVEPARCRAWSFCRAYPGVPEQIGQARADVAVLLTGCPAADSIVLLLSEIASNAILHSRSGLPGGHFGVRVEVRRGQCVLIAVDDDGGPWAAGRADGNNLEHGHGLQIVGALSDGMGVSEDGPRRVVWFRCRWDRL